MKIIRLEICKMGVAGNDKYFYHGITKKIVTVFGAFFNDIYTARELADGTLENLTRVPLSYGPRKKFLARINDKRNDAVSIRLPRMAFEIAGISYDSSSKINSANRRRVCGPEESTKSRSYVWAPVPYELTLELSILARTMDDALQILEQILPTFRPDYTVSIKNIEGPGTTADVMFKLDSVSMNDDYEGDWLTPRLHTYTLTFSTKVNYIGSISRQGLIERTMTVFRHYDFKHDLGEAVIENAEEPKSFISDLIMDNEMKIFLDGSTFPYTIGENVIGETSGHAGILRRIDNDGVVVFYLENALEIGENLIGETSQTSRVITGVRLYDEEESQ